ncbi:bifunctional nicotinamidase/pyrazinamidase [Echinicola marina]|uniref:bifunctional nicotinamidase/pyrazinamidase n=1 Tax=Echinicola marina TaxID=2859768 RepID=UPI001CF6F510|nr:bifunctional nicotinamidase/pyrazinamidase [Echinicola marina]UCS92777.1 bifunctional nicotinamidase/pyrazinamidase [Echinicola marina]
MDALLIVDVQNDFLPGGTLAVEEGDQIIPVINKLQEKFDFIVATQDWHPSVHRSFAKNHPGRQIGEIISLNGDEQVLWPVHCVEGSEGAKFHKDLDREKWKKVFQKGTNPMVDSYSGFYDNSRKENTGLSDYLHDHDITDVYIVGLAADYCVKFTVLDAIREGFDVNLVTDATKAVNLAPEDLENALKEMSKAGANLLSSDDIS